MRYYGMSIILCPRFAWSYIVLQTVVKVVDVIHFCSIDLWVVSKIGNSLVKIIGQDFLDILYEIKQSLNSQGCWGK